MGGQINLTKTDTAQTPESGKTGIYIDSTNAPILKLSDGSTVPLGGTTLEQIYIDAITGGQSPSSTNPFVTLEQLNSQVSGGINTVLFGGTVQWSGTGLVFDASPSGYVIEGVYYEIVATQLTLTAADATNPRRDRFKLTTSGWSFNTGTPAAVPVAPTINAITEIDRGDVLVAALATTPTVTNENVYLENTEWTTSSGGTGTFDPNSTTSPFAGTKAFEATNIQAGGFMLFTKTIDFAVSSIESIGLHLKLKATMNNGRTLRLQFFDNSDVAVSLGIPLPIDKTNSTTYQFVALNATELSFNAANVRKVRITYAGTGGPASFTGFYVDNVIIQTGVSQGSNPTFTQDEIDAVKNANAPTAANPFATIADTGAGSYPEMQVRENNQLLFDNDYSTGIEAVARTGNITASFVGAKRGAVTIMRHNDGAAFTYPTENLIISGSYVASVDNYLTFILVDKVAASELILCTISQAV